MSLSNNFPTIKPSLLLDFANVNQLDPRITFTRASTATYTNSNGLLTSSATNTPRFDYNPNTGAPQGLLVEEQRTNLLPCSSEFDNAAWTKIAANISANAVASPTGANDSDFISGDTTNGFHNLERGVTGSIGVAYAISIYMKAASFPRYRLAGRSSGNWVAFPAAVFDLTTGSVVNSTGDKTATLENVGNGWYRGTVYGTCATSTNIGISGGPVPAGFTGNSYDGAVYTGGVYVWGAQMEAGAFPTSYVPSTNTFTSRASVGSFVDSTGTLQSAAIDVARNTYNPANLAAAPFLLLEEARTNSIRNSTMVGAIAGTPGTLPTNWGVTGTANGLTRTINIGTENGIAYIDIRYVGTTTSASFCIIRPELTTQIVAASGQTWTSSVYMRIAAGSSANTTDLQTWVVGADAVGATTETALTNIAVTGTMTRFSVSRTLNNASTAFVYPYTAFSYASGVAIDITLRIGLPQLEQGYGATSVIPTSTVAVTRAADVSSSAQTTRAADITTVSTLTPWYNASEGTMYAEFNIPYALTTNSNPRVFTLQGVGGASIDEMPLLLSQSSGKAASFNAFTAGVNAGRVDSTPAFVANTITKAAAKYALNSRAVTTNNTTPVTSATVYTIPTITVARIGVQDLLGNSLLNGYIRRIAYYPRALSNTELQGLTS
jgi:hypothetical protein